VDKGDRAGDFDLKFFEAAVAAKLSRCLFVAALVAD
jgi:hypothetical protein